MKSFNIGHILAQLSAVYLIGWGVLIFVTLPTQSKRLIDAASTAKQDINQNIATGRNRKPDFDHEAIFDGIVTFGIGGAIIQATLLIAIGTALLIIFAVLRKREIRKQNLLYGPEGGSRRMGR